MARNTKASPEVENVRPYLDGAARYLVDQLFGPNGPAWGTRLTEMEDLLLAVGKVLSERFLKRSLQRKPHRRCPRSQITGVE